MTKNTMIVLAGLLLAGAPSAALAEKLQLTAARTAGAITLDGQVDQAWQAAEPLRVTLNETTYKPSNGYDGMTATEAELRAMYDGTNLYLLIRYEDPTHSQKRFPWVKQADGGWRQMSDKDSTGHENRWYEDKVALLWHISEKGFAKKGCEQSCHTAEGGKVDGVADTSAGRHYTDAAGEILDLWHWKSLRTGTNGQSDDQYVNADRGNANKEWGRHSDTKTGGGYYDNVDQSKTRPLWMARDGADSRFVLREADKVPFDDSRFQPGDMLAGIVTAPLQGPRADIATAGVWKDGVWTLEIRRPLVTKGETATREDVQFDDLAKTYPFGLSIFDNTQINHLYHKKAITLSFE